MRIKDNTQLTIICDSEEVDVSVPYYIFTDALQDEGNTENVTLSSFMLDVIEFLENTVDSVFHLSRKSIDQIERVYNESR